MKLDLRKDFSDIYSYVADRVRIFDSATHDGLGGPGNAQMIELGYEFTQAGWVVLVFDTRPDSEADGEWTSQIEGNELEMPHWPQACKANRQGPITLLLPDGSETLLAAKTELAIPVGEMLKAVLLKAREDGIFASLPKAANCVLGVEHFDGGYAWPMYEARGQDNLA